MKILSFTVILMMACSSYAFGVWSEQRLETMLRNSGRFVESDYDEDDEDDIPNWERNALPLFQDVIEESGWSTNQLIQILINIASNGLSEAEWNVRDKRRSTSVAISQLSDINHPLVTNYFHSIIGYDIHGLESIVIPGLFKYSHLESEIFSSLYRACVFTNGYDKAAPEVAMALLDGMGNVPFEDCPAAKMRVAKFLYHSMRQVTESQTWQDEQLAKLIPAYSNSVERLDQVRYLKEHSTRIYERDKATQELDRLSAMPTNMLNSVPWILER